MIRNKKISSAHDAYNGSGHTHLLMITADFWKKMFKNNSQMKVWVDYLNFLHGERRELSKLSTIYT